MPTSVGTAVSEAHELAKRGDIDGLARLLESPLETEHLSVRWAALNLLGKSRAPEAVPHVVPLLNDQDFAMRAGAVVALTRLDARSAATEVAQRLADPAPAVRQRAAESLGVLGVDDPNVIDALIGALDDEVWHVRREATLSLGLLGDRRAIPAIEEASKRERPGRRGHARRALRALRRDREPRLHTTLRTAFVVVGAGVAAGLVLIVEAARTAGAAWLLLLVPSAVVGVIVALALPASIPPAFWLRDPVPSGRTQVRLVAATLAGVLLARLVAAPGQLLIGSILASYFGTTLVLLRRLERP